MRLGHCTQSMEKTPITIADPFFYAKTSLQISVLHERSATNKCTAFSSSGAVYVGEHHHAVFGKMHVGLQRMSADLDRGFKRPNRIFRILDCVSAMRDGLWQASAIGVETSRSERCCGKVLVAHPIFSFSYRDQEMINTYENHGPRSRRGIVNPPSIFPWGMRLSKVWWLGVMIDFSRLSPARIWQLIWRNEEIDHETCFQGTYVLEKLCVALPPSRQTCPLFRRWKWGARMECSEWASADPFWTAAWTLVWRSHSRCWNRHLRKVDKIRAMRELKVSRSAFCITVCILLFFFFRFLASR